MPITEEEKNAILAVVASDELQLKDIEDQLRGIALHPADLAELMHHADRRTGDTVLHLACKKGHYELVRVLLSYSAPTDLKNKAGLLASECVKADKPGQKISALFALTAKRRKLYKSVRIDMDRAVFLIQQALNHIKTQAIFKYSPAIILGDTRQGKSTWINYLLRKHNYTIGIMPGTRGPKTALPGDEGEPVRVGRTGLSETLYPSLHELRDKDYGLVDMPGFNHNFGSSDSAQLNPYDIAGGFATDFFLKNFKDVRATILVIEWGDLLNANIARILGPLKSFAGMVGSAEHTLANTLLVITKPNAMTDPPTKELIFDALTICQRDTQVAMKASGCDPDLMGKIALILKRWTDPLNQQVFVGDITTDACREAIHRKLTTLRSVELKHFRFRDYTPHLKCFRDLIAVLDVVTTDLKSELKKNSKQQAVYEKRRSDLLIKSDEWIASLTPENEVALSSLESSVKDLEELAKPMEELRYKLETLLLQQEVDGSLMMRLDLIRPELGHAGSVSAGAGAGIHAPRLFGAGADAAPAGGAGDRPLLGLYP